MAHPPAGVVVLSDRASRGIREDRSGPEAARILADMGFRVVETVVIPDDGDALRREIVRLIDLKECRLIVTSGGTGLSPRDVTPQVTKGLLDYEIPGIGEAMRASAREKLPTAILSRATAGVRGRCLVINLPGSPRGVKESLEAIAGAIPHAVESLGGEVVDCAPVRGRRADEDSGRGNFGKPLRSPGPTPSRRRRPREGPIERIRHEPPAPRGRSPDPHPRPGCGGR